MPKILAPPKTDWYDELNVASYYGETELEDWFRQHANLIFPHHYVIPFKRDVTSRSTGETKKPDLMLIRHDFSNWAVVEVEIVKHTLNHVLEQTRVFRDGNYNLPEIAQYVRDKFLELYKKRSVTLRKLSVLFDSGAPEILVIADEHKAEWKKELGKLGVKFGIFEIYKDVRGYHAYRIFGDYPIVDADSAQCRPKIGLPNVVEVVGNFTFAKINQGGAVNVFFEEHLTQWCLIKEGGKQYLQFIGTCNPLTLSRGETYCLYRDKSNNYYFRRS